MPLVNVMVARIDWPRAREIAQRIDAELAERRAEPQSDPDAGWLPEPV
jgi:hypothetical protein